MTLEILNTDTIILSLMCYLYGSIPFAYIFTFLFLKIKLTERGTGNIGVANAFGVGGLRVGFLTVFGEASKAAFPFFLSTYLYSNQLTAAIIFLSAAILGTSFSIFLKGRGGQGGTVFLLGLLFLSPYTFLAFISMFVPLYLLFRRRQITSILAHIILPFEIFLIEGHIPFVIFGALAAIFYSLRYQLQKSDYDYYNEDMRFLRYMRRIMKEKKELIIEISKINNLSQAGMKAWGIRKLAKLGFIIPKSYVCPFSVYQDYAIGNEDLLSSIKLELNKIIETGKKYCVRSSANVEDEHNFSYAGQFESYLNISSIDEIVEKIVSIWQSTGNQKVKAYNHKTGTPLSEIKMAVIIQEMVLFKYSGVVFTRNPINSFDEVIIELTEGPGSLLLQDGITPERWIYKWGIWIERPTESKLNLSLIQQIVKQAKYIEKKIGAPVDLEWAYDGKSLYWLQLRKITTARNISIYSNRISKGFMPGIIKPLVWEVNTNVVNTAWKKIFIELIGRDAIGIDISKLTKSFYGRAYFNMGIIGDIFELMGMPRELLELLMGFNITGDLPPKFRPGIKSIKYLPGITFFILRRIINIWSIKQFLIFKTKLYEEYANLDITKLSKTEALEKIEQLMLINTEASYYVIISQLLMGICNAFLSRLLSHRGISLENLRFMEVKKHVEDIDPEYQIEKLSGIFVNLPEQVKYNIYKTDFRETAYFNNNEFIIEFDKFINRFGHLSESGNDFSKTQWKERPEFVLDMIKERTVNEEKLPIETIPEFNGKYKGIIIKLVYARTITSMIYRQRVNFHYEYGYALFRPYILHLSKLFIDNGYIENVEDIFYLTFDELKNIVSSDIMQETIKQKIEARKQEIIKGNDADLPETIIGDDKPPIIISHNKVKHWNGVPVSGGYCSGKVKLVRSIDEFVNVREEDILVIPHSDISWTPILVKGKAIISESGGMLSHCAIVAREYQIPAIVSVKGAMHIPDGTMVEIDGYTGKLILIEEG